MTKKNNQTLMLRNMTLVM